MSIAAAMSSFFQQRSGRTPGHTHQLLADGEEPPEPQSPGRPSNEHGAALPMGNDDEDGVQDGAVPETVPEDEGMDRTGGVAVDADVENQGATLSSSSSRRSSRRSRRSRRHGRSSRRRATEEAGDDSHANNADTADDGQATTTDGQRASSARGTVTVSDLEEEREHIRRRTSACVLFAVFILFRLWVEALSSGDFGLLMICMFGTHFTARFIRSTREREEELDRMIRELSENSESTEINRDDIRMMSFQAQLALAIMESQRQMLEGGFGHPEGHNDSAGVSDEAKEKWDRFVYKSASDVVEGKVKKGEYGSVAQEDTDPLKFSKDDAEQEPHCSICLGEYENGEKLVSLPCKHVYHDDCISSWTENHTRCPLCNLDLETSSDGSGEGVAVTALTPSADTSSANESPVEV